VGTLPAALVEHSAAESVWEDVAAAADLDMDERAAVLVSLCRMAAELTAQHPDPAKVLAWQDPVSPESAALLQRLRRRH